MSTEVSMLYVGVTYGCRCYHFKNPGPSRSGIQLIEVFVFPRDNVDINGFGKVDYQIVVHHHEDSFSISLEDFEWDMENQPDPEWKAGMKESLRAIKFIVSERPTLDKFTV